MALKIFIASAFGWLSHAASLPVCMREASDLSNQLAEDMCPLKTSSPLLVQPPHQRDDSKVGLTLIQAAAVMKHHSPVLKPEQHHQQHHHVTHSVGSKGSKTTRFEKDSLHPPEWFSHLHVDLLPDEAELKRGLISPFFMPARDYHFRYLAFAKHALKIEVANDIETIQDRSNQGSDQAWTSAFYMSLIASAAITWYCCDKLQVEYPADFEDELVPVRGKPCWTYACIAMVFLLTTVVFAMTCLSIKIVNKEITRHPQVEQAVDGGELVVVTRHPITEPTKGGFLAGGGVALSVAAGCLFLFAWRSRGPVRIKTALLAQFALRGATLSLVIAMALEIIGEAALAMYGVATRGGVGNMLLMIIVGASEEGAKLFAAICGTWISTTAMQRHADSLGCCGQCWRVLVESRRALMLAGLAVGFGFMTNENAEYMMAVASTPPMEYSTNAGKQEHEGEAALAFMSTVTITVRVLLNIHPWWTGMSAARVARVVFKEGRDTACPTAYEFLWAIAPSAVAHAMYDFLVSGGAPGFFGLLVPPTFWFYSRWAFMDEWTDAADDTNPKGEAGSDTPKKVGTPRGGLLSMRG